MPRPKKYVEDVQLSSPYPTTDGDKVELTCVHCEERWEMKACNVLSHRADECLTHLRVCDPYKRKASQLQPRNHARVTSSGAKQLADTEPDTQSIIADKDRTISTLTDSESKLMVKNEDLKSRVHALNERVTDLEAKDSRRDDDMAQIRSNMDMMYRMFSRELGLPEKPPWPSIEEFNDRLSGLKKAAAVSTTTTSRESGLKRELDKRNETIDVIAKELGMKGKYSCDSVVAEVRALKKRKAVTYEPLRTHEPEVADDGKRKVSAFESLERIIKGDEKNAVRARALLHPDKLPFGMEGDASNVRTTLGL